MPHRSKTQDEKDEGEAPRISMDYFYMSQKDEDAKDFPLLVAVDEETGEKFARMIGMKGIGQAGQQDWLVLEMSEALKAWGHAGGSAGNIILKSDGENA